VLQAITSFEQEGGPSFEGFRNIEEIAKAANAERIAQIAYLKLRRSMQSAVEQQALV